MTANTENKIPLYKKCGEGKGRGDLELPRNSVTYYLNVVFS